MKPNRTLGNPDAERATEPEVVYAGRFNNHVAVVTGAGSGIGRATARRLAAEGAKVSCLDINADNAAGVAAEIAAAGGAAKGYACDITDEAAVVAVIADTVANFGRITVVANVAGIGGFSHTVDQSLEGFNRIMAVNVTGTFLISKASLPHLLDGGGVIVNVISTAGVMGQAYSAAYCASKGAVVQFTKALAVEYVDKGVRVNGVAPGGVDTPLAWNFMLPEGANPKQLDRLMTPMGFCSPAEVAGAICYLASDEASYASGSILSVDGALSA